MYSRPPAVTEAKGEPTGHGSPRLQPHVVVMAEERDRWVNPHEGLAEVLEDRQSQEGVWVKLRQQQPVLL
jgi:hypothetical protein